MANNERTYMTIADVVAAFRDGVFPPDKCVYVDNGEVTLTDERGRILWEGMCTTDTLDAFGIPWEYV